MRRRRNPNKCKSFRVPNFCVENGHDFSTALQQIVHRLANLVWLSSPSSSASAKQWIKVESRIYVGWVKGTIWSHLCTKVHAILGWCRRPLYSCQRTWPIVYIIVSVGPLKLLLNCEVVEKGGPGSPDFKGGGRVYTRFRNVFLTYTHCQACGWFWLSSVQKLGG